MRHQITHVKPDQTITGVQILDAIKASHEQIIANDMPSTAERSKGHNRSNTPSLLDHNLDCLRYLYPPELELLKHDIRSSLSCEIFRPNVTIFPYYAPLGRSRVGQ